MPTPANPEDPLAAVIVLAACIVIGILFAGTVAVGLVWQAVTVA